MRRLIGLIGTVSGLVHVFSGLGLSTGAADTKASRLASPRRLNCTIFGLSIAVPSLIGFSYFSKKVEVMSVEMESLVVGSDREMLLRPRDRARKPRAVAAQPAAGARARPVA